MFIIIKLDNTQLIKAQIYQENGKEYYIDNYQNIYIFKNYNIITQEPIYIKYGKLNNKKNNKRLIKDKSYTLHKNRDNPTKLYI